MNNQRQQNLNEAKTDVDSRACEARNNGVNLAMKAQTKTGVTAMKVLVQNPLTLSYFANVGRWTSDPEQAYVFKDSRSAIQFCLNHDLSDMQVVLKGPEDRYDVQVPVRLEAKPTVAVESWSW